MENNTEGGTTVETPAVSGVYETDDGRLVLYDEGNPDAYLRSDHTIPVER
jgi:hypothetical protein